MVETNKTRQHKRNNCPICVKNIKGRCAHFKPFLKKLIQTSPEKREILLNNCDECFVNFLSDCSVGILRKSIKFPKTFYPHLAEHTGDLLHLAQTDISTRRKRDRLIRKRGGFLSLILPALASSLFGVISNLITRKINK